MLMMSVKVALALLVRIDMKERVFIIIWLIGVVGVAVLSASHPVLLLVLLVQIILSEYYLYQRRQVLSYLNIKKVSFIGGKKLPSGLRLGKFQKFVYWLLKP